MIARIKNRILPLMLLAMAAIVSSCNKEFEDIAPEAPGGSSGNTIGAVIEGDASFSVLKAALVKTGLLTALKNPDATLTLFAPDNNAMALAGINDAVVNALPASTLLPLLQYHVIAQKLPSSAIPETFPNVQMPTLLPLPVNNPLVKMSSFPSRRGSVAFVNNIPVTEADIAASNGVIHRIYAPLQPPTQVLLQIIAADSDLSYLMAAVARSDESGIDPKFSDVLANGLANLTVFAPTNAAFQAFLTANGLPADPSSFALLPAATVKGVLAYHLLGARAYSVNLPPSTTNLTTLLGALPPLVLDRSTPAPRLLGAGNMGMYANFTSFTPGVGIDINAVNGVIHKIDRLLLPQ